MAGTTWNPSDKSASVTLSGGNLIAAATISNQGVRAIDKQTAGKYYWEIVISTVSSHAAGLANASAVLTSGYNTPLNAALVYTPSGAITVHNVSSGKSIPALTGGGDILCLALDLGANLLWARKGAAGSWNATSGTTNNPVTGVGGVSVSTISASGVYPAICYSSPATCTGRFGDSAFTGAVPSGFTSGWPASAPAFRNPIAYVVS